MDYQLTASDAVYKCRKCRYSLFGGEFVVNAHGYGIFPPSVGTENNDCPEGGAAEDTVWFLRDDGLPPWVEDLVNKANWIKGKITCPKCSGKIGSFDFVGGLKCPCGQCVLPSAHVVKAKIDLENCGKASASNVPKSVTERRDTENANENITLSPEVSSTSRSLTLDLEPSSEMQALSGLDTLVRPKSTIQMQPEEISHKTKRRKVTKKLAGGQNAEREAPEELVCAICLDIYHHPFVCHPCKHTFCEMCLRSLAKLDPNHTRCPLCRQFIGLCSPDSDLCQLSKSLYPKYYQTRQQALNKTRNLPLPWQPNARLRQTSSGEIVPFWHGWQTDSQASVAQTVWDSFSTVSILLVLHMIALLTFLIGYYGCYYLPLFTTWLLQVLKQFVFVENSMFSIFLWLF